MQTEPEQWAVNAWERYGPMIFNCEITGPEALQLVVEERERKLREEVLRTGTAFVSRSANFMQGCVRVAGTPEFREFRATLESLKETTDAQ